MRRLLYIIGILGLMSCTKEISIDYHSHDTRYVVCLLYTSPSPRD